MNVFTTLGAVIVAGVLAQILLPGRDMYHAGWYVVALVAPTVVLLLRLRGVLKMQPDVRARAGTALAAFGIVVVAVCGIVCGLLAPDAQTVVGAPGSSVRVESLGRTLDFPPLQSVRAPALRFAGATFLERPVPRRVVEVQAFDSHGGRLTITQPTGSAFLSPVLLMQSRQMIAGMNLPFDSFSVPAARRSIKAVLFTEQEAAQMRGISGAPAPAILFDVEDLAERSLPHGIALARSGAMVAVAGLHLRGIVQTYPAVEAIAIPNVFALVLGLIAICAGAVLARS